MEDNGVNPDIARYIAKAVGKSKPRTLKAPRGVESYVAQATGGSDISSYVEQAVGSDISSYIAKAVGKPVPPVSAPDPPDASPTMPTVVSGKLLQPGTSWSGTHVTDGLDWNQGRRTAVDIMAAAGTPVGAPEDGVIVRHGSAQGGQSLYFQGSSGSLYWLGHIDGMLPPGTRVRRGARIALISSDHAAPHLHIDRKL